MADRSRCPRIPWRLQKLLDLPDSLAKNERAGPRPRARHEAEHQTSGGSRWWGVLCFGVGECVVVVVGWGVWLWWVGCVGVGVYWLVV
jgi:hypothetical protein